MAEEIREGIVRDSAAPRKKRSLFSKPKWSELQGPEEAVDFFSRAKELYPMRVAEEEQKRQRKLAELEEKRLIAANIEARESSPPEGKRRRTSTPAEQRRRQTSDSPSNPNFKKDPAVARRESVHSTSGSLLSGSSSLQQKNQSSPTAHVGANSKGTHVDKQEAYQNNIVTTNCISLSDSESDYGTSGAKPINLTDDRFSASTKLKIRPDEDDLQMSDEEFPELVQEAREREKQKALERLSGGKVVAEQSRRLRRLTPDDTVDDIFQVKSTAAAEAELDPTIEILVSSWIAGTKPLLVRRKLSQRLKEVRLSWSDRQVVASQPLERDGKDAIFLTWRGKRLFDVTTCRGLGLKIDLNGHLQSDGDGFDPQGRVHLEAWTEELYRAHQKKLESRQQGDHSDADEPEPERNDVVKIRLIMKARNLDPFKLVVKPSTLVEKMVGAFRQSMNIPEEQNIALYFDGDKIDPASKIEDTELGEMDTVEVHLR